MLARRRLAVAFAVASFAWTATLVAVPYVTSAQASVRVPALFPASVYLMGSFLCHQQAGRSFHPWGVRMPVCARCAGLYGGAPVGAALGLALGFASAPRRRVTVGAVRVLLVAAALPTAVAWLAEWSGLAAPSAFARALLAAPLGAAVGWLVTAAVAGEIG